MDFLFKFILGIFLMVFFHVTDIKQIRGWNARFIEFGGALLSYDAWYNSLPKALLKYNIYYDPYKFVIRRLDSTEIPTEKMAASIVA